MNTNNKININKITNSLIQKRIRNEYNYLYLIYGENIEINYKNDNNIIIKILEHTTDTQIKNEYIFIIKNTKMGCYPFNPPEIIYNKMGYSQYLRLPSTRFENILTCITSNKKYCLCCHSFSCPNNWNASITLHKIMDEIKENKKMFQNIVYKILIDQIKDKYLITDINIECYLF